jgi:hypothetical protein
MPTHWSGSREQSRRWSQRYSTTEARVGFLFDRSVAVLSDGQDCDVY